MKLPIKISWDLSAKLHVTATHMEISDRDIAREVKNPIPIELVNYDLVIVYPMARRVMEAVSEIIYTHPAVIKLYTSTGRVMLNLETGELYPENEVKK